MLAAVVLSWTSPGDAKSVGSVLRRVAFWVVQREVVLTLAAVPGLLLPEVLGPAWILSVVCLGFLWVARRLTLGRWSVRTPFDWPVAFILLVLPVGVWAAPDYDSGLRKAATILAGVAFYYAVVNWSDSPRRIWASALLIPAFALGITAAGLVGTIWFEQKWLPLARLYERLPNLATLTTILTNRAGFHPNEVAVSIGMLLPPMLVLGLIPDRRALWLSTRCRVRLWRSGWLVLLFGITFLLFLTQSRTAMAATLVSLAGLALFRWPRAVVPLLVLVSALLLIAYACSAGSLVGLLERTMGPLEVSWQARVEARTVALQGIGDYPFTGFGLGCFEPVTRVDYVYRIWSPQDAVTHAHNLIVQTAADLGIVGLVSLTALLVVFAQVGLATARRLGRTPPGYLSQSLSCGVGVWVLFGAVDALPLGTKPSLIVWLSLGLAVALSRLNRSLDDRYRIVGGPVFACAVVCMLVLGIAFVKPIRAIALRNLAHVRMNKVLADYEPGKPLPTDALRGVMALYTAADAVSGVDGMSGEDHLARHLGHEMAATYLASTGRVEEAEKQWQLAGVSTESTQLYRDTRQLTLNSERLLAVGERGMRLSGSGQDRWLDIYWRGCLRFGLVTEPGPHVLAVTARNGIPAPVDFEVLLDGVHVAVLSYAAGDGAWDSQTLTLMLVGGYHALSICFANDLVSDGVDRNGEVREVEFWPVK